MSQCERVLERLKKGPLTSMQAEIELGVMRCASRINDLRNQGHDIHTEIATVINRFGDECRIGIYRLVGKEKRPRCD